MTDFRYGHGVLTFPVPAAWPTSEIAFRPMPVVPDPVAVLRQALLSPISSAPLRELARPGQRVCILVNDSTRKARSEVFMPVLLDELNRAGVPDSDIFAVVATGTHRLATSSDVAALIGGAAAARISVESHDCYNAASLVRLGVTSRGTPVDINRKVAGADFRILTGSVVHHWFAGFGGGKKALVPGVAGYETIRANHSLLLDPASVMGVLDGNPTAEDQLEAARLAGGDFLLNTVLDPDGEILGVFAGDMDLAHRQACALAHRAYAGYNVTPADLVIASCGGWPKDIDLYQAQKSLENAALACRRGGVVILAAECPEGIGSKKYLEWAERYLGLPALEKAIRDHFEVGGHKAYAMARLADHCRVILISALPPDLVRRLGFTPAATPEEALDLAWQMLAPAAIASVIIMPCASLTVPMK